jgi:hypothetical protein
MKPLIIGLAAAALMATTAFSASAQTVDQRAHSQEQRIQQGERSGALTGGEANRLQNGEARIKNTESRMRANDGGRLNYRQRARLARMERHHSRMIYRLKHNYRHHRHY